MSEQKPETYSSTQSVILDGVPNVTAELHEILKKLDEYDSSYIIDAFTAAVIEDCDRLLDKEKTTALLEKLSDLDDAKSIEAMASAESIPTEP